MRNIFQLTIALVGLSLVAGTAAAQTAVYDPTTGSITLNGLTNVGGIQLSTTDNGGTDVLGTGDALGGFLSTTGDQQLDWLFFSALNGDGFNLGDGVAPTDVQQTTLDDNYFLGVVITGSGVSDPRVNPIAITGGLGGPGGAESSVADGSSISLQSAFDDLSDFVDNAIVISGDTGIASAVVTDGPEGDVFEAVIDGLNVDLSINGAVARAFATPTAASAGLLVTTNDGSEFNYTLTATVPEPTTLGLVGLALVGIVGMRRNS